MALDKRTERELKDGVRYASVQAAIDDLSKMLPVLQMSLKAMERDPHCDRKLYESTKGAAAMLANPEKFRASLEKLKQPDGSVRFTFAPDAANFLRTKLDE